MTLKVKAKLKTLHTNYIKASANPFYQHGTILSTPSFVAASEELMSQDWYISAWNFLPSLSVFHSQR
jgi:hypothetical protein